MNYKIKDIPLSERPREKMLSKGPKFLSNYELLAIIIQVGSKNESAIDLSKRVIYALDHLHDLKEMTLDELMKIKGIKKSKACQIMAALELSQRMNHLPYIKKLILRKAQDVFMLLHSEIKDYAQEHLIVLFLDSHFQLISKKDLFIGSINQVLIHPREVFKYAVKASAVSIILVHNHPSGITKPSLSDIKLTKEVIQAGKVMQIHVVDHIIIGKDHFYSMAENHDI